MGAGNVCVTGKYEGLYYVDYDDVERRMYTDENGDRYSLLVKEIEDIGEDPYDYEYDEIGSEMEISDFYYQLCESIVHKFPSFEIVDKWISRYRRALVENELFYIVAEDNQWSIAIELIEKEDFIDRSGLRAGLYKKYLAGIEEILLDMFGSIGAYGGAWTHRVVTKGEK